MKQKLSFSFIIPVYNRPQEIKELLDSFLKVDNNHLFEILIIEDGSSITAQEIVKNYKDKLQIIYYYKNNTGPGHSRNFGMQKANGNYFIILDSDCLLPSHYFNDVWAFLENHYVDCFGGADAALNSFTPLQKAINYTMTSLFTTGGIRGNKKRVTSFEPRSFNMGISKKAFHLTGGFSKIHPGEDPDLSQRIKKMNLSTAFIPNAFVYHKRRISWKKFYIQVSKFGLVRPILQKWHPKTHKITFWFPTLFLLFTMFSVLFFILIHFVFILPLLVYIGFIFVDSCFKNKNIYIGLLTIVAVFIQFFGYGFHYLKSYIFIHLLNRDPQKQFPHLFFN